MVRDEINAIHNSWIILQQPPHPSFGIPASYRSLLAAIDQGWQVEEPVEVMPTTQEDIWTYCFLLQNPISGQSYRIFLPATLEMERFIERNRFQVIEGRYFENL